MPRCETLRRPHARCAAQPGLRFALRKTENLSGHRIRPRVACRQQVCANLYAKPFRWLIPDLVLKHFLQWESTRFYSKHVAAELFWKPSLQVTGEERQVHIPKRNDSLHREPHRYRETYQVIYEQPNFPDLRFSHAVLMWGSARTQELADPLECIWPSTALMSRGWQWGWVTHTANQPILYCLMCESRYVTTSSKLSLEQVWIVTQSFRRWPTILTFHHYIITS